jgi:hypothetical protein
MAKVLGSVSILFQNLILEVTDILRSQNPRSKRNRGKGQQQVLRKEWLDQWKEANKARQDELMSECILLGVRPAKHGKNKVVA